LVTLLILKILWERLTTIAVEDISFGNPDAINLIQSLKIAYFSNFEHDDDKNIQAMFAAAYMAKSPKDRFIDEMKNYFKLYEVKHEIPDYALDKHTKAGKEMGRSYDHFWLVGAKLNPESAAEIWLVLPFKVAELFKLPAAYVTLLAVTVFGVPELSAGFPETSSKCSNSFVLLSFS